MGTHSPEQIFVGINYPNLVPASTSWSHYSKHAILAGTSAWIGYSWQEHLDTCFLTYYQDHLPKSCYSILKDHQKQLLCLSLFVS